MKTDLQKANIDQHTEH